MTLSDIPFVWADLPGHTSYVLIAISYWLTNIYWLRVTAVMGLSLEIAYFRMSEGAMHAGIAWDVVFILINLYQIYRLIEERHQLSRAKDAHLLRQGAFAGFNPLQLARLVKAGQWRDIAPGTTLTQEGEPVRELVLICSGEAVVEAKGHIVAHLRGGGFVGEMAFVSGRPASATVQVETPMRAFFFDMDKLHALVDADDMVATAMHRVIGVDLARKIALRNAEDAAA